MITKNKPMSDKKTEIRDNITPPPADLQNVRLETSEDGIAVITFDHPDKAANIFDIQTLVELEKQVDTLSTSLARGVIFISAKPSIFIAGADLNTLGTAKGDELRDLIEKGQMIFTKIAALEMPTVAAIHGACLGGGFELALACDTRIASSDKATKIGLPETMLGIIPAWGGSTRLPRLIGVPQSLNLILAGKQLAPKHALKLGVVDKVVPKETLREREAETEKLFPDQQPAQLCGDPDDFPEESSSENAGKLSRSGSGDRCRNPRRLRPYRGVPQAGGRSRFETGGYPRHRQFDADLSPAGEREKISIRRIRRYLIASENREHRGDRSRGDGLRNCSVVCCTGISHHSAGH